MSRISSFAGALFGLALAAPASAQYIDPDTCSIADYSCQLARKERDDKRSSDARSQQIRDDREEELRALLKAPPLAAERNVLLGTWRLDGGARQSDGSDIGFLKEFLANPFQLLCTVSFGSGISFTPTTYSISGLPKALGGAVAYRSGGTQAIAAIVIDRQVQSMLFEIAGPNRIVSAVGSCPLVRVGARRVEAVGNAAAASSGAPRRAAGGGIANSGVSFGASIETVNQSLAGKPVSILSGTYDGGLYRLVADGDFPDIDSRVIRMGYEFDAPEGPGARVTGVMVVYRRDRSAKSAVYAERVSALSQKYPLAPQSPTKMEGSVPGLVVSVIDDAIFEYVYEFYRAR